MQWVSFASASTDGDHGDGGGLLLRIRGEYASWVYRFTSPSGKRREMGLGAAPRSSAKLAGASLTEAREAVEKARKQVRDGLDPIDERDAERARGATAAAAKRNDAQRLQRTLAWCARDYHARVIEPKRTTKHGLQWIASLEHHVPAALWRMPIDQVTPPA